MTTFHTRRLILRRAVEGTLGLVAATIGAPIIFASCKKNDNSGETRQRLQVVPCPEQNGLSVQEQAIRTSLKYEDGSQMPGRTCDNCKLYTLPEISSCGGCKVVPGPIHPKGYCTAWLHRM